MRDSCRYEQVLTKPPPPRRRAQSAVTLELVAPEVPKAVPIKVPMAVRLGVPSGSYRQD